MKALQFLGLQAKKIALMVGTGSVALMLAACYGNPYYYQLRTVTVLTSSNEPIPGLTLELRQAGALTETQVSGTDGSAQFYTEDPNTETVYTARDTDGSANLGDFADASMTLGSPRTADPLTMTMSPKP